MQEERFQIERGAIDGNPAASRPEFASVEQEEASELQGSEEQAALFLQEEPLRQYCIFRAGRERFCFSILDVEEIVEWPRLTAIPLAPAFLMGIFNLRGSIIPVVDIAITEGRRVDLSPRHIVVAGLKAEETRDYLRIGIAADELIGTYNTADSLIMEGMPVEVPHCCGLLPHDDRLALVLDLKKVTEAFPVPVI
jgi:purine-binding chemotaxis protein CheW